MSWYEVLPLSLKSAFLHLDESFSVLVRSNISGVYELCVFKALLNEYGGQIMKWFFLSLTILFAAGCQSTASSSTEDDSVWVHTGGCDN